MHGQSAASEVRQISSAVRASRSKSGIQPNPNAWRGTKTPEPGVPNDGCNRPVMKRAMRTVQRSYSVPSLCRQQVLFSQRVVGDPARALRHWRVAIETKVVIDIERLRTCTVYSERRWRGRGRGRASASRLSVPRALACDMRSSRSQEDNRCHSRRE
jgi:hypothetical protein